MSLVMRTVSCFGLIALFAAGCGEAVDEPGTGSDAEAEVTQIQTVSQELQKGGTSCPACPSQPDPPQPDLNCTLESTTCNSAGRVCSYKCTRKKTSKGTVLSAVEEAESETESGSEGVFMQDRLQ